MCPEPGSEPYWIAHAAEVKNKRYREGLLANTDSALQSRELARIRIDVPVELHADALKYKGPASRERCFQIFTELGFRMFAHEYAPTVRAYADFLPIPIYLGEEQPLNLMGPPWGTAAGASVSMNTSSC